MSVPRHGWTKSLRIANLRADPSGVQDSGTVLQTLLLPGMSTVTRNIRYISLFTAAQYWRHEASKNGKKIAEFRQFSRKLEALIALSSTLHHEDTRQVPNYVVGRNFANSEIAKVSLKLDTGVQIPAYTIYRGTLGDLGIFNLNSAGDPLFERAIPIGQAWDIDLAGPIGALIKNGFLPERISRQNLKDVAKAFCLCRVPTNSKEQRVLTNLLFGLNETVQMPDYDEGIWNREGTGTRVASWRLLLELINQSPGRRLDTHYLMTRLLEPDLLEIPLSQTLKANLFLWRWVSARSLFEIGWTIAFNQAFEVVKSSHDGIGNIELIEKIREQYRLEFGHHELADIKRQVDLKLNSGIWLAEEFEKATPKSCIELMIAGAFISHEDLESAQQKILFMADSERDIPFKLERERINRFLQDKQLAEQYWAEIASEALVQHTRIAMRKLSQGNPDTQHVEFEDGRWMLLPGRENWDPQRSTGFSRLDIGMGWLLQLGLINEGDDGSWTLTKYGLETLNLWDEVFKTWL